MKKRKWKWTALLTAGCMAACVCAGCGSQTTQSEGADSDGEVEFVMAYSDEPKSLDPKDLNSIGGGLAGYDLYDTLLNFSQDGKDLEPCLAESWEQVDSKTYKYKIREDVKFSDGNAMTMEDVLYSLNRVIEEKQSMSYVFENVDHFEADEDTWEIYAYLKTEDVFFKYAMATSASIVVEKSVVEAEGDNYGKINGACVGTGPYMLESWASGTEIVLVKNPYYWNNPDSLAIDRVKYEIIEDNTSRALAVQSGKVDFTVGLSSDTMAIYQSCQNMNIINWDCTRSDFLAFDCQKEPFDDVNARKAVAYCIDKSIYANLVYGDLAVVRNAIPFSDILFYLDEEAWEEADTTWDSYEQDYEKAGEALTQSKYSEGFSFDFYCTETYKAGAEAIQSMIKDSGLPITMNIVEVNATDFLALQLGYNRDENGNRAYDMLASGWESDYVDPLSMMESIYASGSDFEGGSNQSAWHNDEFDSLVLAAHNETEDSKRSELLLQAMEIAVDDCAYVSCYQLQNNCIISDAFTIDPGPAFLFNCSVADIEAK